jgi:membrane dipeptidase
VCGTDEILKVGFATAHALPPQDSVSKSAKERAQSVIEKVKFVNLCEPANYIFPASFVSEMKEGGVYAANITTALPWGDVTHHLERYYLHHRLSEENSKILGLVNNFADLEQNHRAGKVSFILGLQGLDFMGTSIGFLETFRKLGLLVATLAYNRRNAIGDGCNEPMNSGLSLFGREVVAEMNRLGIVIDFAHVGERTAIEAAELSKDPVINSHANCAAVNPHSRNISDEQIHAIAEKDGVVGSVGSSNFIRQDRQPTVKDFVAHIKHVADVASINTAGVGLDTYPWKKLGREDEFMNGIRERYPETKGGPKYHHVFESTLDWPRIVEVMVSEGFSDGEINRVMSENALRVFKRIWK